MGAMAFLSLPPRKKAFPHLPQLSSKPLFSTSVLAFTEGSETHSHVNVNNNRAKAFSQGAQQLHLKEELPTGVSGPVQGGVVGVVPPYGTDLHCPMSLPLPSSPRAQLMLTTTSSKATCSEQRHPNLPPPSHLLVTLGFSCEFSLPKNKSKSSLSDTPQFKYQLRCLFHV